MLGIAVAATVAIFVSFFSLDTPRAAVQAGPTFAVKKTDADKGDSDLSDSVCSTVTGNPRPPADARTCTLRAAIQNANRDPDKNRVEFQLPGPATITLSDWLPELRQPIEIDGWSQSPGGSTVPQPSVRIDGSTLPRLSCALENEGAGTAFFVRGAGSLIRGLNIAGFPCDDIAVRGAGRTTISGNYLGTNSAGTAINANAGAGASASKNGVHVELSPGTIVGGANPAAGNVVTSPTGPAILVAGGSSNTQVLHNKVGVSAAGDVLLSPTSNNAPWVGIVVTGRTGSVPDPISVALVADNHVAGIDDGEVQPAGIRIGPGVTGAEVLRNLIGTNGSGDRMVVQGAPFEQTAANGIEVRALDPDLPSPDAVIRENTVAAMNFGIVLAGAGVHHASVEGNLVGVAKDRTTAIPNAKVGVLVTEASRDNVIGYARSDRPDPDCAAGSKCNIVANNRVSGVALETPPQAQQPPGSGRPAGPRNTIRGNSIYQNQGAGIDRPGYGITPNDVSLLDENVDFPIGVTVSDKGISGLVQVPDPEHADLTIDVYRLDPGSDQRSGPNDRGVMRPGVAPDGSLAWPSSPTPDNPSSFGEGRTWIGTVAQDRIGRGGNWLLPLTLSVDDARRYAFTATVTDSKGNTSEFSAFCPNDDLRDDADNDDDSLCDDWERLGIDNDGDGVNDLRLQDPPFEANPDEPDVFVEIDYIDNSRPHDIPEAGWSTGPAANGLSAVVQAFADAPSPIALHLSPGSGVGLVDEPVVGGGLTTWFDSDQARGDSDFFDLKLGGPSPCDGSFGSYTDRTNANCAAILGAKSLVFRYVLFANAIAGSDAAGRSQIGGSDAIIAVSHFSDQDAILAGGGHFVCWQLHSCWADFQGTAFMHELGHTLGLRHGGRGDMNNKPNQLSIMNYAYSDRTYTPFRALDFARSQLEPLDEANLNESAGLNLTSLSSDEIRELKSHFPEVVFVSKGRNDPCEVWSPSVEGPIDWDKDGQIEARVSQHLRASDEQPDCTVPQRSELQSFEEWSRLDLNFRDRDERSAAALLVREPPYSPTARAAHVDHDGDGVDDLADNCQAVSNPGQLDDDQDGVGNRCDSGAPATNLSVRILPDRVTVAPGESNRFVIQVANNGSSTATRVLASILTTGLSAATYVPGRGTFASFRWAVGDLVAGETAELTITAQVTGAYSVSVNVAGVNAQVAGAAPAADALSVVQRAGRTAPGAGTGTGYLVCLPSADLPAEIAAQTCTWIGPNAIDPTSEPTIRVNTIDNRYRPDGDRLVTLAVGVDPNGPALNGSNALVNARVSLPIPAGFVFVAAQLDDTSSDFGQPWSYSPTTGIWRLPQAARFVDTLLVTVRRISATGPVPIEAHVVSWEKHDPSPTAIRDTTTIFPADATTVVPDNDDRVNARALTGDSGATSGDLQHATSRYIPPGANGTGTPAVLDLPHLPLRNYRTVWFTYDAPGVGRLQIDLHTSPSQNARQFKTEAVTVFDANGAIVFGTKSNDRFPTAHGSFVTARGRYTIAAYYNARSVADNVGDLFRGSIPYTLSWSFTDTAPPQTTITRSPKPRTNERVALFRFASNEPGSTFACRLDSAAASTCASPLSTAPLADGPHTVFVTASDRAGNADPTPSSRSFIVDSTPPQTTITLGPSGRTANARPRLAFRSSEAGSIFRCRLDHRPWAGCQTPRQFGLVSVGPHVFEVQATDPAGNRDPTPARRQFSIVPRPVG